MRIAIRVKPGSARPGVGGEHAGALVVRVSARAVDGKATEAALAAVAASFGVRRSAVRLVSGASSRTKIIDIAADDPRILAALLAAPGRLRPQQDAAAVRPSDMSDVITRSAATHSPRSCRARMMRSIPPIRHLMTVKCDFYAIRTSAILAIPVSNLSHGLDGWGRARNYGWQGGVK